MTRLKSNLPHPKTSLMRAEACNGTMTRGEELHDDNDTREIAEHDIIGGNDEYRRTSWAGAL